LDLGKNHHGGPESWDFTSNPSFLGGWGEAYASKHLGFGCMTGPPRPYHPNTEVSEEV